MTAGLASFALFANVAGAATSMIGSYYEAQSQKSRLAFQARMAELDAQLGEKSAQAALLRGERQAGQLSLKAGQVKSSQRARLAANGIDLGVGSAAEQLASTDVMKETDLDTIQANAIASAWGHRIQATDYLNNALLSRTAAESISPGMAAFTSLLGSAGHVAASWKTYEESLPKGEGG